MRRTPKTRGDLLRERARQRREREAAQKHAAMCKAAAEASLLNDNVTPQQRRLLLRVIESANEVLAKE